MCSPNTLGFTCDSDIFLQCIQLAATGANVGLNGSPGKGYVELHNTVSRTMGIPDFERNRDAIVCVGETPSKEFVGNGS